MPVISVHRTGQRPIFTGYAQELSTFAINGYFTFEFGSIAGGSVPWSSGTWVFLTYANTTVTQEQLTQYADVSPPAGFTAGAPVLDTANKRVLITLTAA
jgi:hypothetical protein